MTSATVATEQLFDFLTNHEHDESKAGARRIVHAVVEERFTARANGDELLQPAVTGAERGREHDEIGRRRARCYRASRIRSRTNFRPRASVVSTVFDAWGSWAKLFLSSGIDVLVEFERCV